MFDLDGTLVDSGPAYFEAERDTLAHFGGMSFTWEEHAAFIGVGSREMWERVRVAYSLNVSADHLLRHSNRLYLEYVRQAVKVFPATADLARRLHRAGVAVAVASGSSREVVRTVLAASGLDEVCAVFVSAEEVGRGKPDPAVFLEACRRLGARTERCVVVEDSAVGVEAGLRAGMRCVAVTAAAARPWEAERRAGRILAVEHADFRVSEVHAWITDTSPAW
nr:HAD family phosphatase [Streptomyces taklimakanensis]